MPSLSDLEIITDRTGFPAVILGGPAVSLLPVTLFQLERSLAEPGGKDIHWYRQLLEQDKVHRTSWRNFREEEREDLFVVGITSDEAEEYVRWVNKRSPDNRRWDIPELSEWRRTARLLYDLEFDAASTDRLLNCPMHSAAIVLLNRLIKHVQPQTWGELALHRGGIMEWVRERGGFAAMGAPRHARMINTFDIFRDAPLKFNATGRPPLHGIRLMSLE